MLDNKVYTRDESKIPLHSDNEQQYKEVDVQKAQLFTKSNDKDEILTFMRNSGQAYLLSQIFEVFNNFDIQLCFLENSTITTTIKESKLSAFTTVYKDYISPIDPISIFNEQYNIISHLQKERKNTFWHRDFFIANIGEGEAYYSVIDDKGFLPIDLGNNTQSNYSNNVIREIYKKDLTLLDDEEYVRSIRAEKILNNDISSIKSTDFNERSKNRQGNIYVYNNQFRMNFEEIITKFSLEVDDKVENLHRINHYLFHEKFLKNMKNNYNSIFLSVPLLTPFSSGYGPIEKLKKNKNDIGMFSGLGAVFVFIAYKPPAKTDGATLYNKLENLSKFIFDKAKNFASFYSFSAGLQKAEEVKKHRLQAAISQILARNFAHNIGSHVAIRATNNAVKDRICQLYNFDRNLINEEKAVLDWLDYSNNVLNSYEVTRNEYLASYRTPPKNVHFYREVIMPFIENNLIMDNIAASENICYIKGSKHNRLRVRVFFKKDELKAFYPKLASIASNEKICYPLNFPYLLTVKSSNNIAEAFINKSIDKDVEVGLTNEHSFYSILENFIRNSAKHNKKKLDDDDKNLEIYIRIEESTEYDFYNIDLYDNVSCITKDTLLRLKSGLDANLFDEDGELIRKDLGLADMKINAHLLRSVDTFTEENIKASMELVITENCDLSEDQPFFYDYKSKDLQNILYRFAYRFKLAKPKKIIWIGQSNDSYVTLNDHGIVLKNKDYIEKIFQSTLMKEIVDKPLASFSFAILEKDAVEFLDKDRWEALLLELPYRVLLNFEGNSDELGGYLKELIDYKRIQPVKEYIKIPSDISNISDFDLLKLCWENWLKRWLNKDTLGYEKAHLYIYFENDVPFNSWQNANIDLLSFMNISFLSKNSHKIQTESDSYFVFFDHHSNGFDETDADLSESINRGSYFQIDKSSEDFNLLFYPPLNDQLKSLILYEALEAGLMRIVVLDERIAEKLTATDDSNVTRIRRDSNFFSKGEYDEGTYADLFNLGKTYVVTKFCSEKSLSFLDNFELYIQDKKVYIEVPKHILELKNETEVIKNYIKNYDGLIMHRTYLNKILDDIVPAEAKDFEKKQIVENLMIDLYNKFGKVIITSGGGYPHSLPIKVNFQPFNYVNNKFSKYLSKISLVKLFS